VHTLHCDGAESTSGMAENNIMNAKRLVNIQYHIFIFFIFEILCYDEFEN